MNRLGSLYDHATPIKMILWLQKVIISMIADVAFELSKTNRMTCLGRSQALTLFCALLAPSS